LTTIPWTLVSGGVLVAIVLVGIFAIWRLLKEKRSGFPISDERTQKITGTSATYAFYIGSYFMVALMFMNILSIEFTGAPLFERGYNLAISIMVQGLTFIVVQIYLKRKIEI
jgi:hypothetical protein